MLVKFSVNVVNSGNVNVNLNVFLVGGTLQTCPFLQQQVKEKEVYVAGNE